MQEELLNNLIDELKDLLSPIQKEKRKKFKENKWPVAFIVGNPRSGTTILLQWLSTLNAFSYPSNLLARFSYAPYLGGLIQKMFFDDNYDPHGDFYDINSKINFNSDLGKSRGALATNEFQHFFRNHMPNFNPKYLNNKELNKVNFDGIKKDLATIEKVFCKPFVCKNIMLQFNIPQLFFSIPNSFFIYIKRNPTYIMQSILLARKEYFNDYKKWWSVKPKEYASLKKMDIYHQIAGQVYYTNLAIENGLKKIPDERKMIITYEDFCKNPKKYFNILSIKYKQLGYYIKSNYNGPKSFANRNKININSAKIKKLKTAYKNYHSGNINIK